jgi:hypothetical protein
VLVDGWRYKYSGAGDAVAWSLTVAFSWEEQGLVHCRG